MALYNKIKIAVLEAYQAEYALNQDYEKHFAKAFNKNWEPKPTYSNCRGYKYSNCGRFKLSHLAGK